MIALARRILIFKSAYWVNVWGNCTRPVVFRLFLSTRSGSSGPRVNSVRLGFRNDEQTFFGGIEENVRIVLFFLQSISMGGIWRVGVVTKNFCFVHWPLLDQFQRFRFFVDFVRWIFCLRRGENKNARKGGVAEEGPA